MTFIHETPARSGKKRVHKRPERNPHMKSRLILALVVILLMPAIGCAADTYVVV